MIRLYLVRHGQTLWNKELRYNGRTDLQLTTYGQRQAAAVGQRCRLLPLAALITSGLRRSIETASAINAARPEAIPIEVDTRWQEIDYGQAEGLRWADICQRFPEAARTWAANDPEARFPGGESLADVATRVKEALTTVIQTQKDRSVALIAHGGSLRVALCLLLGMPLSRHWNFNIGACSLSEVAIYPSGAVINLLNDTCHLRQRRDEE
ncbi:MAG: histidine phosphatase family protein [Chloroflexi bacterium]|nr:histidine phosphatase family protein [Chloroflexota bacterium]